MIFLHRLIHGTHDETFFLSETTKPRALIFDMEQHLVDFYQAYSNNAPAANNSPVAGIIEAYIKMSIFYSKSSHVHVTLMEMKHRLLCKQMFCPFKHS